MKRNFETEAVMSCLNAAPSNIGWPKLINLTLHKRKNRINIFFETKFKILFPVFKVDWFVQTNFNYFLDTLFNLYIPP
ncbi:MAG: hypothetical protein CMI57_00460 [Parcubacteria group bacterium]|nr:hypothetical protein [Parcubacteria group bacterium]